MIAHSTCALPGVVGAAATMPAMDLAARTPLLGGLSPDQFMRRHWQRKPLVVRGAWPGVLAPVTRTELFALAGRDDVESRLVTRSQHAWTLRHGPLPRRCLPALSQRRWTLLVQGVDLHVDAAQRMLECFRFVPDARLDDLMISYASAGGGVGPHVDAYDVFLLQLQGRRRWRIGPVRDRSLVSGAPLKLLRHFQPAQEWVLGPGDMLYMPPHWGHDGAAVAGACMTASIGYRAPARSALVRELMHRVADSLAQPAADSEFYRDAGSAATRSPAQVPDGLLSFARDAWRQVLGDGALLQRALGEWLTEPKPQVWFEAGDALNDPPAAVRLDRRSRMMYDVDHVYLNGESWAAGRRDAQFLRRLADERGLAAADVRRLSASARQWLDQQAQAGWLHEC